MLARVANSCWLDDWACAVLVSHTIHTDVSIVDRLAGGTVDDSDFHIEPLGVMV